MNRTAITLGVIALVAIMFIGVIIIALFRPDATATMIFFVGSTLSTITSTVVIFYQMQKVTTKVDKIEKQTNGINTALLAKVTELPESVIDGHKQ